MTTGRHDTRSHRLNRWSCSRVQKQGPGFWTDPALLLDAPMNLTTTLYLEQVPNWPARGRHILAQFDDESVVVYQAYRPETGHFAAQNSYFGGGFRLDRM